MNGVKAKANPTVDLAKQEHLTSQSARDISDLNITMAKYGGIPPAGPLADEFYQDFSNVAEYKTWRDAVAEAELAFEELPAKVRQHFDHDLGKLLEFMDDPSNAAKASELGLLDPQDPRYVQPTALNADAPQPAAVPAADAPEEPETAS